MERNIYIEPLQKRFTVGIKNTAKTLRNPSFLNASDCHGAPLKEEKYCAQCKAKEGTAHTKGKTQRKLAKVGGEIIPISAQILADVKAQYDNAGDVRITAFLKSSPKGTAERISDAKWCVPAEKQIGAYAELGRLLEGRVGVGTAVFNGNEYQVVLTKADNGLVMLQSLVDETMMYAMNAEEIKREVEQAKVPENIVDMEKKLLERKTVKEFDLTEHRDGRIAQIQEIIEQAVLTGEVPKVVENKVAEKQEVDEEARLAKLLEE